MPTKLPQSLFTTTLYVDFQHSAGIGTKANPYNNFTDLNAELLTYAGGDMAVQIVLAGTSSNSSYGIYSDRTAESGFAVSRLGVRAWQQDLDGARPSGQPISRPLLSANMPFAGSLTQVGATAVYKNSAINPAQNKVSQVCWKYGIASQFDVASGSYNSFLKVTTGALTDDNTIAATLSQYQAYYSTANKQIYVNTTGLSTTLADWSWTEWQERIFTQFVESYSDGIDTMLGNRGHAFYDALPGSRCWNARGRDHDQHHCTISQSNRGSINHGIEDGQFFGLGRSGDPAMVSLSGGVAAINSTGCYVKNCYFSRYVLFNPGLQDSQGGTNTSTPATRYYTIWYANCGTGANAVAGTVLDWTFEQNICEDVPNRVDAYQAFPFYTNHNKQPAFDEDEGTYSIRVKRCSFKTEGIWNLIPNPSGTANDRYASYLFEDCYLKVRCNPDFGAGQYGIRVGIYPSPGGFVNCGMRLRLKRSNLVVEAWSKYTGTTNPFRVIGGNSSSVAGDASRQIKVSADKDSSITAITGIGNVYLFGFGNAVAEANQAFTINCKGSLLSVLRVPVAVDVASTFLSFQDSTTGTTARIFQGCRYNGFSQTSFSSQYATPTLWAANVDTAAIQTTDLGKTESFAERVDAPPDQGINRPWSARS